MLDGIDPNTKVEIAAQDSDLQAIFELRISETITSVNETRAGIIEQFSDEEVLQLHKDIMRQYDLSENDMRKAIGRCVASKIEGIDVGFGSQFEK